MTAAYQALDPDLLRRIDGRRANHDSSYTSVGELRKGASAVTDVVSVTATLDIVLDKR